MPAPLAIPAGAAVVSAIAGLFVAAEITGKSIAAHLFNILANLLLAASTFVLGALVALILVYIFAGWIKAMLGVAFMPIAMIVAPMDRGAMLARTLGFVAGAIASYAFALAAGLILLAMISLAADNLTQVHAVGQGVTAVSGRTFALSMKIILLAFLMGIIILNTKNWGAEFFGSSSFNMGVRLPKLPTAKPSTSNPKKAEALGRKAGQAAQSMRGKR